MKNTIKEINNKLQKLIMLRGTKEQLIESLKAIGVSEDIQLIPVTNPIEGNDDSYDVCLGTIDEHYLDYTVYMLPTNKDDTYIITEIDEI